VKKLPDFRFENKLWRKGYKFVAGCDEVGRGCFAGPVVASVCIFAPNSKFKFTTSNEVQKNIVINDSKKLTRLQRERASRWIKENCIGWGIGLGSVAEINRLGLSKATNSAFRRAVKDLNKKVKHGVDYLLIDAFYIPYIRGLLMPLKTQKLLNKKSKKLKDIKPYAGQLAIVNGDERSFSIAAASIIAKVYRDKLMKDLSKKFVTYGWETNKGYGTRKHISEIKKHGSTKHHRKIFVASCLNNSSSFPVR
jgi:ribonuclease HII